ncbi:MAG: RNA polymerase sigma factor [Pyrinomonadaceae bacterium]
MKTRNDDINQATTEATTRLLARATNSYSLHVGQVIPRVAASLEKYLLRNRENVSCAEVDRFVDELHADELCLVLACECGDESAWGEFVERFTVVVRSAARSASSNEDTAQDLAQSIWAELYGLKRTREGQVSGKLAYYSGRGSLAGWLRAVVAQLAVDSYRKQARLVQTEEDSELDRLAHEIPIGYATTAVATTVRNPEQLVATNLAQTDLQEALTQAIQELSPPDRLLVRLYYFDGLRLREAGFVLGVHEATASRRLNRIHQDLHSRVLEILVREKSWTTAETEASLAELGEHLDADVESLFRDTGVI